MGPFGVTVPQVLTEAIFSAYGGETGTATSAQITAAFCVGEQLIQQQIGTFLTPTSVTGTLVSALAMLGTLYLEHSYLRTIDGVVLRCEDSCSGCDTTDYTACAHIKNFQQSIIELRLDASSPLCGSCAGCGRPLSFWIDYTAGIPPGQAESSPTMLLALTTIADIALEQITDPGASEGGPGDPGVQSWSSFKYREERVPLIAHAVGSSARANYAANLVRPWRVKRSLKLGWG